MKRSFHHGVFSKSSVRYAGNNSDITSLNNVTKDSNKTKKNRSNTRLNFSGNNYKMKKNFNYNNIINEEILAMNDIQDDS